MKPMIALVISGLVLALAGAAAATPLPTSPEQSCGFKEPRVDGELRGNYGLMVNRVSCHTASRLARRYIISKALSPGWHARYANYSQELFLCRTAQKYGCTHGRHVRLVFPDAQ